MTRKRRRKCNSLFDQAYTKKDRTYTNATTGQSIDYYEVEVKEFEQQVYPGLKPAKLVGYDGMSPGPTFRMERGREAVRYRYITQSVLYSSPQVVRFINHAPMDISVHLHGAYSRAPFDGWAEDTTKRGQYKDYCKLFAIVGLGLITWN